MNDHFSILEGIQASPLIKTQYTPSINEEEEKADFDGPGQPEEAEVFSQQSR